MLAYYLIAILRKFLACSIIDFYLLLADAHKMPPDEIPALCAFATAALQQRFYSIETAVK